VLGLALQLLVTVKPPHPVATGAVRDTRTHAWPSCRSTVGRACRSPIGMARIARHALPRAP
jgi:hypothetical protein